MTALACATLIVVTTGCSRKTESSSPAVAAVTSISAEQVADTIYVGGDIVTINDAQPTAEALAVKGGKILAVGARADVESAHKGDTTKVVDLAGKDVPSIVAAIEKFRTERSIPQGQLIQAYGYDDNVMPDGRLLNRDDLDQAFPDNPVLVGHVSMHGAVMNSAALKHFGIAAATRTPPGGVIVRKPGSNEPYGLVMETAYLPVFSNLPQPTREQEIEFSKAAQMLYAESGVTTAHEGATHAADLEVM